MKHVIFDLDGTLLDTIADLNSATNHALLKFSYPSVTIEETTKFIGNGIKLLIERSLKGQLDKFDLVFAEFKKYYLENVDVLTKEYPGMTDCLVKLKSHGYHLAVLSNKAQAPLDLLINNHFNGLFDVVVGDRPDMKKKPELDGFKYIADTWNVDLSNIIYIGDSDVDVKTCLNANAKGVFVSYGFRSREDLIKAGADVIVDDTVELYNTIVNL